MLLPGTGGGAEEPVIANALSLNRRIALRWCVALDCCWAPLIGWRNVAQAYSYHHITRKRNLQNAEGWLLLKKSLKLTISIKNIQVSVW
jgi:hypothetical protein